MLSGTSRATRGGLGRWPRGSGSRNDLSAVVEITDGLNLMGRTFLEVLLGSSGACINGVRVVVIWGLEVLGQKCL